eukprot:GEMP01067754.1.p1 GENE.GEMP01067754.1~~GEMP01067754.1.p1  ORF type:complete len:158 (+),score=39.73 GEMP01067754.1:154-627(+)
MGQSGKKFNKRKGVNRLARYSKKMTDSPSVGNKFSLTASPSTATSPEPLSLSDFSMDSPSPCNEEEMLLLLRYLKRNEVRKIVDTELAKREEEEKYKFAVEQQKLVVATEEEAVSTGEQQEPPDRMKSLLKKEKAASPRPTAKISNCFSGCLRWLTW